MALTRNICLLTVHPRLPDCKQREKTSQAFRDALHDQYRSSNGSKNKKKRRLQEQGAKAKQHLAPNLSSKSLTDKKKIALLSHEHTESMERSSFSGQKLQNAIRSIIDEAEPTNVAPAWFNNSSTNLEFTKLMGQAAPLMRQWHEEDEVSEKSIDALHRPNAFNDWHSPQRIRLAESANEIALNSDKLKNILDLMTSKRAPYARQPRSQVGNYTSAFEPSTTMGMTTGSINEKSIILSPIGDGSTRGLFKLLQGMGEGSERSIEGRFSPLPL